MAAAGEKVRWTISSKAWGGHGGTESWGIREHSSLFLWAKWIKLDLVKLLNGTFSGIKVMSWV
jgi:hypothetical protein